MSYRTYIIPSEEKLEFIRKLWMSYGEGNGLPNKDKEALSIYPKGKIGNTEVHVYGSLNKFHLKIMLIGEIGEIENTRKTLEQLASKNLSETI